MIQDYSRWFNYWFNNVLNSDDFYKTFSELRNTDWAFSILCFHRILENHNSWHNSSTNTNILKNRTGFWVLKWGASFRWSFGPNFTEGTVVKRRRSLGRRSQLYLVLLWNSINMKLFGGFLIISALDCSDVREICWGKSMLAKNFLYVAAPGSPWQGMNVG